MLLKMTPSEALQHFVALKLHFSSADYDAIKYHFKTRHLNLDNRKDKYFFIKLARQPDPKGLCIANISYSPTMWVGELFEPPAMERYWSWRRYQEGLTYYFSQELKKFNKDDFKCPIENVGTWHHPQALKRYLRQDVSLDTLTILNDFIQFDKIWDSYLNGDPVWQHVKLVINKYRPFISYDREKIINVMSKHFFS